MHIHVDSGAHLGRQLWEWDGSAHTNLKAEKGGEGRGGKGKDMRVCVYLS